MITYNETIERIRKVFKEEFNIELDNFSEKTELGSLGICEILARELEKELCNEFMIYNINSISNEEITIEEIANEIMEEMNSNVREEIYNYEEDYEEDSDGSILIFYVFAAFIFGTFILLMLF